MPLRYNKAGWITLAIGLLAIGSVPCFSAKMNLDESVEIALRRSPAIGIAREGIRRADADLIGAKSAGAPKLIVDAQYNQSDRAPVFEYAEFEISLGSKYSRLLELSAVQPIDLSGAIRAGYRSTQANEISSKYDLERQTLDTILDVASGYYDVQRAKKFLSVQEENLTLLEAYLKDAQAALRSGSVSNFDVLRAETELANAHKGLIIARNSVELAKAAFYNTIGIPLDTPADIEDAKLSDTFISPDARACSSAALEFRPEIKSAESRINACEYALKAARLRTKPKADVRLGYMYNFDPNAFIPKAGSVNVMLCSTMPLFDGGSGRAQVEKTHSELRQACVSLEQIKSAVKLDVQQACLSVAAAGERAKAAEKLVDEARESKRLASVSYRGGLATQLEVLTAESGLVGAETARVNAVFDYQVSMARLERSVGGRAALSKVPSQRPMTDGAR